MGLEKRAGGGSTISYKSKKVVFHWRRGKRDGGGVEFAGAALQPSSALFRCWP